jgi:hypothetical protein
MTPLAIWQAEVGGRLLVGDRPPQTNSRTPAEKSGWPITIALYRQWRVLRIRSLAPLTLARLGTRADLTIEAYIAANPGSSSFAGPDAAAFLRFATRVHPDDPYLDEIAFLEGALIRVRRPESVDSEPNPGYVARSRRATVARVPFPAIRLMLWLAGRAGPPAEAPSGVLIAPAVPGWVRQASHEEAELWHWLAMDRPLHLLGHGQAEPMSTLRQANALRYKGGC